MAAASQAVPGEFDSRHLLQVSIIRTICLQQANGSDYLFIYCFPHQVSFLQEFFGENVNLIQISLESVEELLEVDSCFDKQ